MMKSGRTSLMVAAALSLLAAPSSAQNLLQNSDLEAGFVGPMHWTKSATASWGNGPSGFGPITYHSPTRYIWVVADGVHTIGTLSQNAGLPFGAGTYNLTLSFWGQIHDVGGDPDIITAEIIVDGATVASVQQTHADGLDVYKNKQVSWSGTANVDLAVKITLEANDATPVGFGVLAVDDIELTDTGDPDQPVLFSIDPELIPDADSDTSGVTITGTGLTGVTAVKLEQGATVLTGAGTVIAGDGESLTTTFPTDGAPFGLYDVVAEKPGKDDALIINGFLIRDPDGSLVFNGDFETGDLSSWGTWFSDWGGTPAIQNVYVGGVNDVFVHTPKVGGVPTPVFDTYSFRSGEGTNVNDGGEGGIYQQIPVFPGETLLFTWKWGGGSQVRESAQEIGIAQGAVSNFQLLPDETYLDVIRMENETGGETQFGWDTRSLTVTVPAGVDRLTVYTRVWHLPTAPQAIALWADDMSVVIDPQCGNQHTTTSIDPVQVDIEEPQFDLTVFGTNLDQVTAVRLRRGPTEYTGTDLSPAVDGTSITATFNTPAEGAEIGDYDVITEQDGCLGQRLDDGFNFDCLFPTAFGVAPVSPPSLTKPQGLVELTITGSNLDRLASISLEQPELPAQPNMPESARTIPGVVLDDSNPSAITVEFDLYKKAIGRFDLVGTRVSACGDPATVTDAFEVLLPPDQIPVGNAGFEVGVSPWVESNPGDTIRGPHPPGDYFGFLPYAGSFMAGKANNGGSALVQLEQSLGLPSGAGHYDLTLGFWMISFDGNVFGPGERGLPSNLTAQIIVDQGEPTQELSTIVISEDKGVWPAEWLYGTVDWSGTAQQEIKIKFWFNPTGDGGPPGNPFDIHWWGHVIVDDVSLYGIAACNDPFADADGDGDVDHEDFGLLQACITGTGFAGVLSDECRCFDAVSDNSVDQLDVAAFELCATGPEGTVDPCCDGGPGCP